MPAWSLWVTFILATLGGALALAMPWHRRRRVVLGLSVQPYRLGGHVIPGLPPRPHQLLQLDITNRTDGPLVITGARMRLAGERTERPVFDEATGEGWIINQPLAPGASAFVKCSAEHEALLARIERITVYANGQRPVALPARAARAGLAKLRAARRG